MSQSGLSRTVLALEARLNVPLVVHNSRPVRLTSYGAALAEAGATLLRTQAMVFDRIANLDPGSDGTERARWRAVPVTSDVGDVTCHYHGDCAVSEAGARAGPV